MHTTDARTWLKEAAAEVLETMCFMEIVGPVEVEPEADTEWISATLSYKGNGPSRKFGVCTPSAVAEAMAANLLGEDGEDVDRLRTADTLGEISNMICGGFLRHVGTDCVYDLSHPVSEFGLALPQSEAILERFQVDEGPICVWTDLE